MGSGVVLVVPEAPAPAAATAVHSRKLDEHRLRLGILDNSKGNADHLLRFVVEGIRKEIAVASVVSLRKGSVSLPAPAHILDTLERDADFVVSAMAD